LGGDGLVPISVLGDERFHHDERACCAAIDRHDLCHWRSSAAASGRGQCLTGALKFEPEDGQGRIERRGVPLPDKAGMKRRGSHLVGKRGRPANIRHQGKKR
jgi:ribonuclease R